MADENDVVVDSSPQEVAEPVSEDVETPAQPTPEVGERTVPYERFKKVNEELTKLKKEPVKTVVKTDLDVEDFIGISAALDGLDSREKEYLAKQHKQTGKPLEEIRKEEDFGLWQDAYRAKREKELSLKPSGTQTESDKPMTFAEKLKGASLADKEKLLEDAGLYKHPRPRPDRVNLGRGN